MNRIFQLSSALVGVVLILSSCGRKNEVSRTTGWEYNSPEYGGFEKLDYEGQINGPNLVLIEGGTFTMGLTEEDVTITFLEELPYRHSTWMRRKLLTSTIVNTYII